MKWPGEEGPAWNGGSEFGSRVSLCEPHPLPAVWYGAGCFTSLCPRSLICRTGVMTVPAAGSGCGFMAWCAWSSEWCYVLVRAQWGLGLLCVHCSQSPAGGRRGPRGGRPWFLPWEGPAQEASLGKASSHREQRRPRWARAQQASRGREVMAGSDLGVIESSWAFIQIGKLRPDRESWSQREPGQGLDGSPGLSCRPPA